MPRRSRHLAEDIDAARNTLAAQGVDPDKVSFACVIGHHIECQEFGGKIMMRRVAADGHRYERCECPTCNHPEPRVRSIRAAKGKARHRRR